MTFVLIGAGLAFAVLGLFSLLNYFGRSQLTPAGAADIIERFLRGEATEHEWDDFSSVRAVSVQVEEARKRCVQTEETHSSQNPPCYLDAIGVAKLGAVARDLRAQPNNVVAADAARAPRG